MIKDSGTRREFNTGAVRDIQEGKGRCDLLPLDVLAEICPGGAILHPIHNFTESGDVFWLYEVLATTAPSLFGNYSTMFLEVSKHFEEGALKYGERNVDKGIPQHSMIDSAIRHLVKYIHNETDESHLRAAAWNVLWALEQETTHPEMIDLPGRTNTEG